MPAAPARLEAVGELADHRVRYRVNDQRKQRGHAGQAARQAENLVEIKEQEDTEDGILDAG